MRKELASPANGSRERYIDIVVFGLILLMLAASMLLVTSVGWLAYRSAPLKAPAEAVRELGSATATR